MFWLDEIVETPTDTILYDENGNPVNLEDCTLEWTNGRQLKSVSNGDDVILSYTYDDAGIRTSKTYQGVTTYYCTENGVITSQYQLDTNGNKENEVIFIYDNGSLVSAYYDSAMYYYITNAMGDVISIVDESGNTVVDYAYDGWGNTVDKAVNTTPETDFAEVNPMLYRSYYYDEDLGVYYLQSRYYKADWCRFINSDLPSYAQEQQDKYVGLNLFAYCCNEPIDFLDYDGLSKKPKTFWAGFGAQLEFSLYIKGVGSVVIGLEIVWYHSKKVKIGWNNRAIPYLYWFLGGSWGYSSAENWLNNKIQEIISKGVDKIITSPATFSASLCLFIIKGFKSNKNGYKIFDKPSCYLGEFHSTGASLFHFKGYKSWSTYCNVYGVGYDCSKYGFTVLERTNYRYVPGYNKLAASFSSLCDKVKKKINNIFF